MADVMTRAAADGGETVRRMLQFVQPPHDEAATVVDLTTVMQEVVRLTAPRWRDASQAEGRPIELALVVEGEASIQGTAATLREAMTNLVLNAVDALPAGGDITLSVRAIDSRAVVVVADSGLGMSEEVQARIFEPFFTTKGDRGTGLGLPIVFGIVEAHHGEIAVQSEVGGGSSFTLSFPLFAAATRDEPATHAPARRTGDGPSVSWRCLVVDDEPRLAQMLGTMLDHLGHQYILAKSGEEALEKLASSPVDVLLTAVGLGPGMNGWELAERALARFRALRVVLATGWGASIDPTEARSRGIVAILSKPFRSVDIQRALARVGEHIADHGASDGAATRDA
jgi:CheY-like chemotaxis protein/anti-sigma regulatory factor (Ser/Thr protein kinase)